MVTLEQGNHTKKERSSKKTKAKRKKEKRGIIMRTALSTIYGELTKKERFIVTQGNIEKLSDHVGETFKPTAIIKKDISRDDDDEKVFDDFTVYIVCGIDKDGCSVTYQTGSENIINKIEDYTEIFDNPQDVEPIRILKGKSKNGVYYYIGM